MEDETDTEAPEAPALPPMPQPALAEVYAQRRVEGDTPPATVEVARWDGVPKLQVPQPVDLGAAAPAPAAAPDALGAGELDDIRGHIADLLKQVATLATISEAQDSRIDELANVVAELRDELGEGD